MWYENAQENREMLRVVGIPHEEVPMLEMFMTYLDMEYRALANKAIRDDNKMKAVSTLRSIFKSLLTTNGDLFNTITSDKIDGAKTGWRVLYDFSELMMRGSHIAMAQLVNIISFAVGNLGQNDLIIFHGADLIDKGIMPYLTGQFAQLYKKGGRVAFLYNSYESMLDHQKFNRFDTADYTVFGSMSDNTITAYQKQLGQNIPSDLIGLVTEKGRNLCYIRRDFDNVVFEQNLQLDPLKRRKSKSKSRLRL